MEKKPMRLCNACLQEKPESQFYNSARRRYKCKECEKNKVSIKLRTRQKIAPMKKLKEQEGERFWLCNIKRCTKHKRYHPLTAFSRRFDTHDGYAGFCKQARSDKKKRKTIEDRKYNTLQQYLCCKW